MEHAWYCLLLLLGSASLSHAQNTVCKLSYNGKPITDSQWTTEVSLTNLLGGQQLEDSRAVGQIVIEFDAADIQNLGTTVPGIEYLQPQLNTDKTKFTITVGKDFPKYEENVKDQVNIAKKQLAASFPLVCSVGATAVLNILIDLKDTNNHAPTFLNGGEALSLPMPFPPGVKISRLLEKPITIEDIDFSTKQIDLTIDNQQYFSVQSNKVNDVTWTADIVTKLELNFQDSITITLTATDVSDETSSRSSQQTYTINIDAENTAKNPPEFTQPLYQQVIANDNLDLDLKLQLTEPDSSIIIDLECHVDPDNEGDKACDLLAIGSQASDGSIPITWKSSNDDLSKIKYILATISATSGPDVGYTVIHIVLPLLTEPPATTATPCEPCTTTQYTTEACEPCTTTVMECPTTTPCEPCTTTAFECTTTVMECPTTTPCEPCTTTAFECPTTTEPTTTECPVCTTTAIDCPTVTTTACEPCTTTVMECTTPPIEPCECTTNTPEPGTTSHCEPCEPCECGSTTTSIPGTGPDIKFEKESYVTTVGPNEYHDLFIATVKEDYGYTIKYSLIIDDVYLRLKIGIEEDTGRVWLKTNLLPGSYEFHLKAEAMGTNSTDTVPALVGVTATCNCDGGQHVFSYALLNAPVTEHEEQVIFHGNITDETCNMTKTCYPESADELVRVTETGELSIMNVDREIMASLVIDLQITCTGSEGPKNLAAQLEYDPNIAWDVNSMRVVVTVDDINDHKPQFPSEQYIFGYPNRNLLPRTMPSGVGVVVATDDDEGDNAKIKYSTDSEKYNIHPDTGLIYVRHDALDYDEQTFVVTARDSPTVGNSLTATANVMVKILDESHIFVITVEDATIEDIDEVLNYLSSSSEYSVHALSVTSAFEGSNNSTANSKRLDDAAISMIVYALNKDGNPVTMNEFQSSLPQSPADWTVSAINSLPVEYGEASGTVDNTGFIAAVSVLGALLGLLLLGFAFIYIFVIRPKLRSNSSVYRNQNGNPYDQQKPVTNEGTEEDAPRNTGGYNAWTTYNTSNQPKNNGLNHNAQEDRKPSVTIWKQEFDEKTGKIRKPESSDNIEEDEENDYDRRKSLVTFNENVECIEVDRL